MKKYESYKNSGIEWIGDVPEHWEVKSLKYVADVMPSNVDKKSTEGEKSVRLCNYVDVYKNNNITNDLSFMDATASDAQIEKLSIRYGDVIATKDSEDPNDIAVPTFVSQDFENVVCGYHLTLMRAFEAKLFGHFLFWIFSSKKYNQYFSTQAKGVTRYAVGISSFKNLLIPLPTLEEQTQIAKYLDQKTAQIDKLIADKQKLIELLNEERTAIINQAVTKGLSPNVPMKDSGVEWLGEIPEHWEVWKLAHAFKKIGGGTTPESGNPIYHENGTINWLNTGDLNDDVLNETSKKVTEKAMLDYSALKLFPPHSVVIAMYGATIGKTSLVNCEITTNQACCVFYGSDIIENKFLFNWFLSNKANIINLSKGGGQPNVSMDILKSLKVPCPSQEEQNVIVKFIEMENLKIGDLLSKVKEEIELLKEYKTALISEVVTGKVDVRGEVLESRHAEFISASA